MGQKWRRKNPEDEQWKKANWALWLRAWETEERDVLWRCFRPTERYGHLPQGYFVWWQNEVPHQVWW